MCFELFINIFILKTLKKKKFKKPNGPVHYDRPNLETLKKK
jgi:hypothetical protein